MNDSGEKNMHLALRVRTVITPTTPIASQFAVSVESCHLSGARQGQKTTARVIGVDW